LLVQLRPQVKVFLFDEPLSNLDAKLRVAMRAEIKALHQRLKTTTVYVTHDQVEAMTMADRIVVMHDGVVEQIGAPLELYDHPRNLFVAQFIGSPAMNIINGKLRRAGVNAVVETQDGIRWPVLREPAAGEGLDASYGVRPEHLAVVQSGIADSVPGEVVVVEPTGPETELLVRSGTSHISVISHGRASISPGDQIALRVAPGSVHLFDQKSGSRIPEVAQSTQITAEPPHQH
jgi:multiple sugar transport system ATP-binding protein